MKKIIVFISSMVLIFIAAYFGTQFVYNWAIASMHSEPEVIYTKLEKDIEKPNVMLQPAETTQETVVTQKTDVLPENKSNNVVQPENAPQSEITIGATVEERNLIKIEPQGCPYAEMMTADDPKCILSL